MDQDNKLDNIKDDIRETHETTIFLNFSRIYML